VLVLFLVPGIYCDKRGRNHPMNHSVSLQDSLKRGNPDRIPQSQVSLWLAKTRKGFKVFCYRCKVFRYKYKVLRYEFSPCARQDPTQPGPRAAVPTAAATRRLHDAVPAAGALGEHLQPGHGTAEL